MAKLKRKFGVVGGARDGRSIAYRETITRKGEGQGRHKKQSRRPRTVRRLLGAHGAACRAASGYQFDDQIVGGSIPTKFIPAVDEGSRKRRRAACSRATRSSTSRSSCSTARTTRSTRTRCRSRWPASSRSRPSRRSASRSSSSRSTRSTSSTPDEYLGDVMGDLSSRRGQILGTEPAPATCAARASARSCRRRSSTSTPRDLHSMTHGRGTLRREFHGYEQMPGEAAQRVITETHQEQEATVGAH